MYNEDLNDNNNKSLIEKVVTFPIDKVFSLANSISNIFSDKNKIVYESPSLNYDGKYNNQFLTENNLEPNKKVNKSEEIKFKTNLSQEKTIDKKIPFESFEEIQYKNFKNQYDFYKEQKKFINNLQKNYIINNYENFSEEEINKAKTYIDHINENIYSRNKLLNESKPYILNFDIKRILSITNHEENNSEKKINIKKERNSLIKGRKYIELNENKFKDKFHKQKMKYDSYENSYENSFNRNFKKELFLLQENNARYESIILRKERENAEMKKILEDYEKNKNEELNFKDLKIKSLNEIIKIQLDNLSNYKELLNEKEKENLKLIYEKGEYIKKEKESLEQIKKLQKENEELSKFSFEKSNISSFDLKNFSRNENIKENKVIENKKDDISFGLKPVENITCKLKKNDEEKEDNNISNNPLFGFKYSITNNESNNKNEEKKLDEQKEEKKLEEKKEEKK